MLAGVAGGCRAVAGCRGATRVQATKKGAHGAWYRAPSVANNGPALAAKVTLGDTLPIGSDFVFAAPETWIFSRPVRSRASSGTCRRAPRPRGSHPRAREVIQACPTPRRQSTVRRCGAWGEEPLSGRDGRLGVGKYSKPALNVLSFYPLAGGPFRRRTLASDNGCLGASIGRRHLARARPCAGGVACAASTLNTVQSILERLHKKRQLGLARIAQPPLNMPHNGVRLLWREGSR
jgi:hypothetical protein